MQKEKEFILLSENEAIAAIEDGVRRGFRMGIWIGAFLAFFAWLVVFIATIIAGKIQIQ